MRFRVAAMILAVQCGFVWWVADSEIAQSVYLICYSLMMPTVLYLLLGGPLRWVLKLELREWLLGYMVLTATLPIVGFGALRFLLPGMGFLPYFSSTQPQWARYLPLLPTLPVLQDPAAIQRFFLGESTVPWAAWALPIAFWSAYLLLLHGVWLGLAAALHRSWIHHERLTFPIAALPLELTQSRFALLRQPLFWWGVALPAVLQSLLVFHEWYPTVPAQQLKMWDVKATLFPNPPWSAIPSLGVSFYPMAAGLAYLMPSSISFSCLFFWLAIRLAYPLGLSLGWEAAGTGAARFPYQIEQSAGAWLMSAGVALWAAQRHQKSVEASLNVGERQARARYQNAALACALGAAALLMSLGLPPTFAVLAVLAYAGYVLAGARARAEAGGVWTFAPLTWTANRLAFELTGAPHLEPRALAAFGLTDLVHVDIRGQSLPYLMEALKLGESVGVKWRTVLASVALFSCTALAFGWLFSLPHFYHLGAATAKSNTFVIAKTQVGFREMDNLASRIPGFDGPGIAAIVFGGLLTLALAALRTRYFGFPLHPVGYVLGTTLTMNAFFLPVLIAWLTKTLVLRYGGSLAYRRSVAFFVGLTLGDIGIQTLWTVFGRLTGLPIYQFLS